GGGTAGAGGGGGGGFDDLIGLEREGANAGYGMFWQRIAEAVEPLLGARTVICEEKGDPRDRRCTPHRITSGRANRRARRLSNFLLRRLCVAMWLIRTAP